MFCAALYEKHSTPRTKDSPSKNMNNFADELCWLRHYCTQQKTCTLYARCLKLHSSFLCDKKHGPSECRTSGVGCLHRTRTTDDDYSRPSSQMARGLQKIRV
eukprot:gnl/TRDRNA2_/TRDRNA2_81233_c0_seq1.p2 gnl/TRDRNA2_/TRDRNA2_81233_c0~~gnl/TRDRNA2_/TRDRNA2_81233_c0_seq1.p2  ORF type:complete len:102 (+),score=4.03 gnl/TRDRNA2_/TRDRNA2_81233_c0_seq1:180-485(+)